MRNVLFVKYNNLRRPDLQIITTIYEENGEKIVEKKPCCEEAIKHVAGMAQNYELLNKAHRSVSAARPYINENIVRYKFFTGKTLEEKYQEEFDDIDNLLEHIREDIERIYDYYPEMTTDFYMTPLFAEMFGERQILAGEKATLAANIDLALDNIMIQDDQWILIDYEWVLNVPVPISFLKYRSVSYFWNRHYMHLIKHFTKEEYLMRVGVSPEHMEMFDEMEECFQEYVRGENWKYHVLKKLEKPAMPFERYMGLVKELESRDEAIAYLNDLARSKDQYIEGLEQLLQKYHNNPVYRLYNIAKKGMGLLGRKN